MKAQLKKSRTRKTVRADRERWIPGIKDADLKKLLADRARMSPDAAPNAKRTARARSVPGFVFMRPSFTAYDPDRDPDDPRPPQDPCAGQTWVWQPDLAVQLNTGESQCPSAADLQRVQSALGGHLARFRLSDPEVRVSCAAGNIRIHIWGTRVQPGSCADRARQRAQVPDLVAGGNFGLFINASLIRRLANEAFQNAPKTFSENGAPSSSGPFHVTGLSIGFKPPDVIETYISGYDERPWPDVSFTKTIRDQLNALLDVKTTESTDYSVISQVIAALVLGVFTLALPLLLPVTAFVLFSDIDAALNTPDNPAQGGVGFRLLKSLPQEIPLPQTGGVLPPIAFMIQPGASTHLEGTTIEPERKKLVIAYGKPAIDNRGLFVGALATRQDRVPSVRILGPSSLSMFSNGTSTFGHYTVEADDTFGSLGVTWSGSGPNIEIVNPSAGRTRVNFGRGNAGQGDSFQRTLTVRVTDAEGTRVTASRMVTIFVNESGGLPPVCQVKPWLPQCNPEG